MTGLLVHLCLDVVILGIVLALVRRGESEDFLGLVLICVVLIAINSAMQWLLREKIGGLFTLAATFLVDGAILRWWARLDWEKALSAVAILTAAKAVVVFVFSL